MRNHFEKFQDRDIVSGIGNTRRFHGFARRENGSVTILALFVFLIILMVAGIGIDLMRFERDRASLQSTLDRAVLAAADLDQKLPPEAVVRDYLDKAGLLENLKSVQVREGIGFRNVTASAEAEIPTYFMHLSGVDTLNAPADSAAEESVGGVEISLILDVSGSMNDYNRLTNLKVAAKDFIDQMVDNTEDGKLSISIVPYATQVSISDEMMSHLQTSGSNDYANCLNFASSEFGTTTMDLTTTRPRTLHMNPWNWSSQSYDNRPDNRKVTWEICDTRPTRDVMVMQKDASTLKTYIQNFEAWGNTSIDVGMKWGTALLDNSLNPLIRDLVADGVVPATFSSRPAAYGADNLKIIVLMTDGANTSQYMINEPYRSGPSNIYWNSDAEVYSTYDADRDAYYWHGMDRWEDHAYGDGTYEEPVYERRCVSYRYGRCRRYADVQVGTQTVNEPGSGSVKQLTWPELWEQTTVRYVRDLQAQWMGSSAASNWYYDVVTTYGQSNKDPKALSSCGAAKDKGVIVYTVAFEAPSAGKSLLKSCASSDSHYYDVEGLEIADAFASIASSIRKLRLIQ